MSDWNDSFERDTEDSFGFDDCFSDETDDSDFDEGVERTPQRISLQFSLFKTVAALVGGLLAAFLGGMWFVNENGSLWRPLVTAVYVLILALCVYVAVRIAAAVKGDDPEQIAEMKFRQLPGSRRKTAAKSADFGQKAVVSVAVLFLASGIFEFLYDLGAESTAGPPSSYILALDTSGSMDGTDPDREVAGAVQELISGLDNGFPYAIYTFDSGVSLHTQMHQKTDTDAAQPIDLHYGGGTEMGAVLKQIMDDFNAAYKAKTWQGGENAKVVLFSDGQPNDKWELRSVLKSFQREGIAVSTVSVQGADAALMQEVAEKTGGAHIAISDISVIGTAIENAMHAVGDVHRTLFTFRNGRKWNGLYALMRIVFLALTIMGFWGVLYFASALGMPQESNLIFFCKVVTAVIAGLLTELGLQYTSLSEGFARLCFCLLAAFAVLQTLYRAKARVKQTDNSFDDDLYSTSHDEETVGFSELD